MQNNYRLQQRKSVTRIPGNSRKRSGVKKILFFLSIGIFLFLSALLFWKIFPYLVPFSLSVPDLEETLNTPSFALRRELKEIENEKGFLPDFLPEAKPEILKEMMRLQDLTLQYLQDDTFLHPGNDDRIVLPDPADIQKERYPERIWEFVYSLQLLLEKNEVLPVLPDWRDRQILCRIANFAAREYRIARTLSILPDAKEALDLLQMCAVAGLRSAMPDIQPILIFQKALWQTGQIPCHQTFLSGMADALETLQREPFPQKRFIMTHRLKTIQDFERLRLNGISLFLGERLPEQQIKDAVRDFRIGNFFTGIGRAVRDWQYQEDQDELIALQLYRFLLVPDFVPASQYPPVLLSKIPPHCILARIVHQNLKNTIEQLTYAYGELENFSTALDILKKNTTVTADKPIQKFVIMNRFSGENVEFIQYADHIQWTSGGMIRLSTDSAGGLVPPQSNP